ncbi:unnamed protein product [Prorocentrum cordatum]|uniref:DOT1 domain-containing protein n=1 Tax=Prorocentrum cordatum TaxID=2364126 RepID=A0ABN9XJR5_9DINO|nr:unnamed protein product [Polarella glacialis]
MRWRLLTLSAPLCLATAPPSDVFPLEGAACSAAAGRPPPKTPTAFEVLTSKWDALPLPDVPDFGSRWEPMLDELDKIFSNSSVVRAPTLESRSEAQQEVASALGDKAAAVYGEMLNIGTLGMLHHLGAQPGQRFYDLGSGTGKATMIAWLWGLHATGIELVSQRWQSACRALEAVRHTPQLRPPLTGGSMRQIKGNLAEIDVADADFVFSNSVMFPQELVRMMARHLGDSLRPGALVVCFQLLQTIDDRFVSLGKIMGPATWKLDQSWHVHKVVTSPADAPRQDEKLGEPQPGRLPDQVCELLAESDRPS